MVAIAITFDPIEYSKQMRNAGFNQEQAEIQAQTIEKIIHDITTTTSQDLVTKSDLKTSLKEMELQLQKEMMNIKIELIKWVLGTGVATILAIAGLLKYIH